MSKQDFDAIVVGARCAGSPAAMLLARAGHRVLVVDRARFPSDTMSTHAIWQRGLARAAGWGLLDRIRATTAPAVHRIHSFGAAELRGCPPAVDGVPELRSVRRPVLDQILVDEAARSGAQIEQEFLVTDLIRDGDAVSGIRGRSKRSGGELAIRAPIVIGADGKRSTVARLVGAEPYLEVAPLTFAYYSYWSGTGLDEILYRAVDGVVVSAFPTNDGLSLVYVGARHDRFTEFRTDVEGNFMTATRLIPELADRLAAGRRVERFTGTADLGNYYRQSHGAGWALAGDAAHHRDPITGQGISEAWDDAQSLAAAIHQGLTGQAPMAATLAACQAERDARTRAVWEYTLMAAALVPEPDFVQKYLAAAASDPVEVSRIFGLFSGAVPHWEVLTPDNMARVLGQPVR